ncbi:MAG: hypothetical protein EOO77_42025, partial [Oxalobacteraceae bacterium]
MSENTLLSVPLITVDMISFEPDRDRVQSPDHIDTVQVRERERDAITGDYTGRAGNAMTIERMMPRPYTMTMQVDIWTANMDQKHQLLEQIDIYINPSFDIQNSDNPLDWTALTTAFMESQTWSSLSIPIGTENEIDVATITLKIPMWLTPPARVSRQTLIHQVVTNIATADRDEHGVIRTGETLIEHVTTPDDCHVRVERGVLTLLGSGGEETRADGSTFSWHALLAKMGAIFHPSETQIRLRCDNRDIIGVIQPTDDDNRVIWQTDIDTLPHNTLSPIDRVIDPRRHVPGEGNVAAPSDGQRYLLLEDLASNSLVWGAITAREGSIIERRNGAWVVVFSGTSDQSEYVVNRTSERV